MLFTFRPEAIAAEAEAAAVVTSDRKTNSPGCCGELIRTLILVWMLLVVVGLGLTYGNFQPLFVLHHFARVSLLYATPHAPCDVRSFRTIFPRLTV